MGSMIFNSVHASTFAIIHYDVYALATYFWSNTNTLIFQSTTEVVSRSHHKFRGCSCTRVLLFFFFLRSALKDFFTMLILIKGDSKF